MDSLIHTPEEHPKIRRKVEGSQKIHTIESQSGEAIKYSQEYTKDTNIENYFIKDIRQIFRELEKTIPTDLPR